jgi:hypothetical protein
VKNLAAAVVSLAVVVSLAMDEHLVAEVEQQHQLLATWIGSSAQPAVLDALRAAHTADFSMVTVDGHVLGRQAALDGLAGAANSRPGLRILISDVTVAAELVDAVLVGFLETHVQHGHTSSRRVTALLRSERNAPHGLRWRHVHETPIPQ